MLVVCPLKSIIEDQIAEAKSMGIPAAFSVDISEDELCTAKFQLIASSVRLRQFWKVERRFLDILKF